MMTKYQRLHEEQTDLTTGGGSTAEATPSFRDSIFLPEGKFADGWHDKMPAELKDYIPSVRSFDGVGSLIKGYGELKKMLGAKIEPPGEGATPEQIAKWRQTVGAPEDLKGYDIAKPEGATEWDDGLLDVAKQWAHQNHLPPKALAGLVEQFNKYQETKGATTAEQQKLQAETAFKKEDDALREIWGKNYDANKVLAARAAATFGIPPDHYALTDSTVVKALHRMAVAMSESNLVKGESSTLEGSPATRAQLIMTDKSNTHYAAYHNSAHPNHQAVRDMVINLLAQR